jgi:hypothetical protein
METNYSGRDRARERPMTRIAARPSMAALPILIGSLVLIVGSFLDWTSPSSNQAGAGANAGQAGGPTLSGYNLPDGRIVMAIGFALLVMAALMWMNRRVGSWFDADLLGVALATIAIVTIVAFLLDVGSTARSAEIGIYISLVGAVIAFGGALAALLRSGSDRDTRDEEGRGDIGRRAAA